MGDTSCCCHWPGSVRREVVIVKPRLGQLTIRAGAWHASSQLSVRLIGLLRISILAHLLLPEAFGQIALVVLVIGSLTIFSDVGINPAVIHRQTLDGDFVHTAWLLNAMRGVLLALICLAVAPLAAAFFEDPKLGMLLQWAALMPFLRGFQSLGMILLERELQFQRMMIADLSNEIVTILTAVLLALYWRADAEAILWGLIAGTVAGTLVSYMVHSFRPQWEFSLSACREIWAYGGHLLGAGVIVFAITNLDNMVVGKVMGVMELGFYSLAFTIAGVATTEWAKIIARVLFPAFAKVKSDSEYIHDILCDSLRFVTGLVTPVALLLILIPEYVVSIGFGERWLPMVPALLILVAMGWVRGVASVFGPVLLARGRTGVIHRMKWVEFTLFAICIVPSVLTWGIVGAALVLLAVYILSLVLHIRAVAREVPGRMAGTLGRGLRGAYPAIVSGLATWLYIHWLANDFPHWELSAAFFFVVLWAVMYWFWERPFIEHVRYMTKDRLET